MAASTRQNKYLIMRNVVLVDDCGFEVSQKVAKDAAASSFGQELKLLGLSRAL